MTLPNWEQLPDLDLYLDQVLLYVNQATSVYHQLQDKPLTAAMVNNYVKQGFLPKPIKKKYQRNQLARLIVLTICKPVFPISDIVEMIQGHSQDNSSVQLYDWFIQALEGEVGPEIPLLIQKTCQTLQAYQETMLEFQHYKKNHIEGATSHD